VSGGDPLAKPLSADPAATVDLSEFTRELLTQPNYAYLATVNRDGSPHVTPVWIDLDGDQIVVNTSIGRVKECNLRRDPRIAVSVPDITNPLRKADIRGTVVEFIEGDAAERHIDRLAKKYLGLERNPWRKEGERRVILKIEPERVAEAEYRY
jgi:PPOX class probable F420-dependent enzyme